MFYFRIHGNIDSTVNKHKILLFIGIVIHACLNVITNQLTSYN